MTTSRTHIKFKEEYGKIILKPTSEIEQLCRFTWRQNINGIPDFSQTSERSPDEMFCISSGVKYIFTHLNCEMNFEPR